jgi:ribonuclease HI
MGVFYGGLRVWKSHVPESQEQTNNRAELLAALHGLRTRDPQKVTVLVTDCEYLVNGYNIHLPKWQRHNWSTASGQIAHADIWKRLFHLRTKYPDSIIVTHCPSHIGIHGNTLADKLANKGRENSPLWVDIQPSNKKPRAHATPDTTSVSRARTPPPHKVQIFSFPNVFRSIPGCRHQGRFSHHINLKR